MQKFNFDINQYTTGALAINIVVTTLLYYFLILSFEYTIVGITYVNQYVSQIQVHPIVFVLMLLLILFISILLIGCALPPLAFILTLLYIGSKLTVLTVIQLLKDTKNDIKFVLNKLFN